MSYTAKNAIAVAPDYTNVCTFEAPEDVYKLDVSVKGVDVLMQCLGPNERAFTRDENREILLRKGANSKPFIEPIRFYRFRQWPLSPFFGKEPPIACFIDIVTFS